MVSIDVVLDKAADLLDRQGHCKGQRRTLEGELCVIAAISEASRSRQAIGPIVGYLQLTLDLHGRSPLRSASHPVAVWNDAPERTAGEVKAALRAAAMTMRMKRSAFVSPTPVPATVLELEEA